MQSLFTFLLRLLAEAWAVVAVATVCGAGATLLYFSSAKTGLEPGAANPAPPIVAVPAGSVPGFGAGRETAPVPAVPEANPGLALIPVVAAMLWFSARRLRLARGHR